MSTPAGWYPPDPTRPEDIRYWDGDAWTDNVHSYSTPAENQCLLPEVAPATTPLPAKGNRWFTSWPAIAVGFLLWVVPGVVLLWLRRTSSVTTKLVGTAAGAALIFAFAIIPGQVEPGNSPGTDAVVADDPTSSSSPSPLSDAEWAASLERGTAPTATQADRDQVVAMDEWLASAAGLAFTGEYVASGDTTADDIASLADTYPVQTSDAAFELRTASTELAEGEAALGSRDYDQGETHVAAVQEHLAAASGLIADDIAALEEATGLSVSAANFASDDGESTTAVVESWIDGDTVDTSAGRVRLIGIDTPELGDQCSVANDAQRFAQALAPVGSEIQLVNPASVVDKDSYDRDLRYIDLADGTDMGYSLLLNDLAEARYDSLDGYDWHPRQKAYRATGAQPADGAACSWSAPLLLATGGDANDDDDHAQQVALVLAGSAVLASQVDDARQQHEAADKAAAKKAAEKAKKKKKESSRGANSEPWNQPGPDLDCPDIGHMVQITGPDYHNLDRDGDGWGCDSYG